MTTISPDWPSTFPAKVALIGEAPAETEIILGRPFVGRAGKVLNGALRQVGLSRWDCLVTNVFSRRLPADSIQSIAIPRLAAHTALKEWEAITNQPHPYRDHVLTPAAKAAYIHPATVAEELSRLHAEISKANPNIVVALGGTAIWALLCLPGAGTVSRIHGALTHEVITGRKAVATYHPAAVGRNPKWREFLLSALTTAKTEASTPILTLDDRTLLIPEHPYEVRDFLLHSCLNNLTAVDIETTKGQIDSICFAPNRTTSMAVPIWHPKSGHYWPTLEAEITVVNHIAWFLQTDTPKIFQYGPQYDIQWLYEHWLAPTMGTFHDTRLMMHALSPEQDKKLSDIGGTYERLGPWKMMRKAATSTKRDD